MRESIKQLVRICAEFLPLPEPIYEFGSLQVPGQEGFADLRGFFPGKRYIGADIRSGPGVDLILDLHDIHLPSESVGTVLSLDTFEHVENPWRAIEEIHRILQKDGIFIISSVMNFPIHEYPYDYWRFTPDGLRSLLQGFYFYVVDFYGEPTFPHTVIGIAFKGSVSEPIVNKLKTNLEKWKVTETGSNINNEVYNVKKLIKLIFPPIIIKIYDWTRNKTSTG